MEGSKYHSEIKRQRHKYARKKVPSYTPYEIKSIFQLDKYRTSRTKIKEQGSCIGSKITSEITSWNPFCDEPTTSKDVIEKWGQMIYRNVLHSRGEKIKLQPRI
ncbi:hypothetical protein JTB14_035868 [Gonioctena quinquepunctata]|nr:hypothetical protein JTB14_035868 [Gonioctena quinquepunctata]